jgi:shikimate kinase
MKSSPIIVELVGPAGAGKTTLSNALAQQDKRMQLVSFPDNIGLKELLFFAWNAFILLPILIPSFVRRSGRKPSRKELVAMFILNGWSRDLEKQASPTAPIILIDQGPVNLLGHLTVWWAGKQPDRALNAWHEKMCRQWAGRLNLVIMLDAADETLTERIRTRQQSHGLKGKTAQEIQNILDTYREAYLQVISRMALEDQQPNVMHFDTTQAFSGATNQEIISKICEGIRI